jgi:hypothetical protein
LSADDHFCLYPPAFEKTSCGRGTLQAQHLLPVPDTSQVGGRTDLVNRMWEFRWDANWTFADLRMQGSKIPPRQVEIESDELQVGLQNEQ